MQSMIQIRNVPEALHRKLKADAAFAGQSLSAYLLTLLNQLAQRPSPAEMRRRLEQRSEVALKTSPAAAVRAERDSR